MEEQMILSKRIEYFCKKNGISYYSLSDNSAVPMTTLMHIINCSTKNPGIFTIFKICNGLNISITEFFNAEEFAEIEYKLE